MAETLTFDVVHLYNMLEIGITVSVRLHSGNKEALFDAKIDTGSSYCIFQRLQGELLDLDIESGIPVDIGTATGSFRAYGHEIEMEVLGLKFVSTVYFAESEYFDRNVLGRIGWLNKVKLGLIDEEGKLYLSKYDNQ